MCPDWKYSCRTAFQRVFPSLRYQENPDHYHPLQIPPRASDMESMSIFERVCLRPLHRSSVILMGLSILTGCLQLDRRDVLPVMALGFVSLPVGIPAPSRSLTEDEGESTSLLRSVTGAAWHVSSLRLVQDDGGSILLHSDRRSESLLQGLDPSLVHPAVRPFLFPSCDVSVLP